MGSPRHRLIGKRRDKVLTGVGERGRRRTRSSSSPPRKRPTSMAALLGRNSAPRDGRGSHRCGWVASTYGDCQQHS
ncbi:hypothetical protein E2562_015432 [Oryza meyeriana var. granulata]|uniref:Uncharacterized protein n=1 Tax=Oryza meyeriana var. granulata TaxID=110450 RepID=A0A6G1BYA9_9ORYZ|nr:hypothetical protein E2562_015432 [Oryza meyeriana var. granulata]